MALKWTDTICLALAASCITAGDEVIMTVDNRSDCLRRTDPMAYLGLDIFTGQATVA
jgi:hypothetical protein